MPEPDDTICELAVVHTLCLPEMKEKQRCRNCKPTFRATGNKCASILLAVCTENLTWGFPSQGTKNH